MRNFICIAAAAVMLLSASCGKKEEIKHAPLDAKALFTQDDAVKILGYEPAQTFEDGYVKSTVRYDSKPIGKDPIIVELYSYDSKKSTGDIYDELKRKHSLRTDSEEISDFDAEAFIAYPSVNIYKDGYMAVVTAGSGADDAQKQLLTEVGGIVAQNLNDYILKHPTDGDLTNSSK